MSKPQVTVEQLNTLAEEFFLVYFNDYLSIEKMAEDYGISDELAYELLAHGKKLNRARPTKDET